MEKPRTMEDVTDRTKAWQLSEIVDAVQFRLVSMPEGTDSSSKVCQVSCIQYLLLICNILFTKSLRELIHRMIIIQPLTSQQVICNQDFFIIVYILDVASCPMFILRLFDFYIQILALGFWHLGQMVFRSCGSGHATNKIQVER